MIYLDNNATTPLDPDVLREMQRVAGSGFGNPGSRHLAGRQARKLLEESREELARILGADPEEVIFTSGGTESSNLAIFGLTAGRTGTIVLPPGEHPATVEPVKRLESSGCRRHVLPLDADGRLRPEAFGEIPFDDAILATALLAHNETGVVQDLEPLADLCAERRLPVHVDAVQAVGKIEVNFQKLNATTLSIGAHKFYGPRGIGALLVRSGCRLRPQLLGGHQEQGIRPGTEPVMLAVGMVRALRAWDVERTARTARLSEMRDRLEQKLSERCPPVVVNGDRTHRLPNTSNVSFPGCDAEALLVSLDLAGLCCSHGSACASGSAEPAPILLAMGAPDDVARSALRLTVGIQNTPEEIDQAARIIAEAVCRQRSDARA